MTEISGYFNCIYCITFLRKVLWDSYFWLISYYYRPVGSRFFLSNKIRVINCFNLKYQRMLWSVWQGIHFPMKLRFGKEAFISCCIISTFEWWLPNNRYLTLLFSGWWCKTLLPDCLYEILFEHWISEDLRTHFPFSIFWYEPLKIKHKKHRSLVLILRILRWDIHICSHDKVSL